MNLMSKKSTLFLCLYNSFPKKSTQWYFSAVACAVPPEEIGRGLFFFTHVIFIRKKQTAMSKHISP